MIKDMEQARDIQMYRVAQGKVGYSKAVRRFLSKRAVVRGQFDWYAYNELKQELPVIPFGKHPTTTEEDNDVQAAK